MWAIYVYERPGKHQIHFHKIIKHGLIENIRLTQPVLKRELLYYVLRL